MNNALGQVYNKNMERHRVLIVDDAPYIRELLVLILTKGGFEIVGEAGDGAEAVQKVQSLKPDLVLMDIVMPLKSGIQAAQEILEKVPGTKVVMMSTVDQDIMSVKALETGAHELIRKPFRAAEVLEILNRIMKEKKMASRQEEKQL